MRPVSGPIIKIKIMRRLPKKINENEHGAGMRENLLFRMLHPSFTTHSNWSVSGCLFLLSVASGALCPPGRRVTASPPEQTANMSRLLYK